MEFRSSREASSSTASHELPSILCNSNIQYRVHYSPPQIPNLGKISRVHITPAYFSKIHINNIHPRTSWFTQPLTEMSTRNIQIIMFLRSKVRQVRKADNLTAIYEPIV
jgi:hypothetical protein